MLVLTRKKNETILIGDEIRIVIVRVKGGGAVQIGVEAPVHVPIVRGELLDDRPDSQNDAA